MKKYFNIGAILTAIAALSLIACTESPADDNITTPEENVEVTFPELQDITFAPGAEYSVTFTPSYKWSMESDKSWIRFSYDGSESSNIAGPAGKEEVTVSVIVSEQPDLSETISGSVLLTIGEEQEQVMTITQEVSFTSDAFEILIADSDEVASEVTLEWQNSINSFQAIITVSAPFDWVVAGENEWLDTTDLTLAGVGSAEPTRMILRPNMETYPATDEQYTLRFENKTNSEIAVEVKVNILSCVNTLFILDGFTILENGVDFEADGTIESNSPTPIDFVNFSVMVYGDEEPTMLLPKCWYKSSEVHYSNANPLGGRIEESTDFTKSINETISLGNFTQYNYHITSSAGEPAMAAILLALKSGNALKPFDNLEIAKLPGLFTALSQGMYGSNGNYKLPELAQPYFYGIITRDGGPYDAAAIPFKLINSAEMNDASFKRMTPDNELYSSLVGKVESAIDLYSFVWNNCFAKNMNILQHEIPNFAREYSFAAYNTDGTSSDWFKAEASGDVGEEVLPQVVVKITPENAPSREAEGYILVTKKDGTEPKARFAIEFKIMDPFTMVSDAANLVSIGRMSADNLLYSKFSEAVSDELNLYTLSTTKSASSDKLKVYDNYNLLLNSYEYKCYNYDESLSYDPERPTLSDTESDWFTFHRSPATAGEKATWWIELVEGKEITYPAKGYITVKDPEAPANKPGSLNEESLFVIEFVINAGKN